MLYIVKNNLQKERSNKDILSCIKAERIVSGRCSLQEILKGTVQSEVKEPPNRYTELQEGMKNWLNI